MRLIHFFSFKRYSISFVMFFDVQSISLTTLPTIFPSRLMKKVLGRFQSPYALAAAPSSSIRIGEDTLNSFLYFIISFSFSFVATLRRTKSVFLNASWSLAKEGDSLWQFGHHVAKKFNKMIFPRSSLRDTFPPLSSLSVKSGASIETLSFSTFASSNWAITIGAFHNRKITKKKTTIKRRGIVIPPWLFILEWQYSNSLSSQNSIIVNIKDRIVKIIFIYRFFHFYLTKKCISTIRKIKVIAVETSPLLPLFMNWMPQWLLGKGPNGHSVKNRNLKKQ